MDLSPGASLTDTLQLVRPLGTNVRAGLWVGADAALGQEVAVKLLSGNGRPLGEAAERRFRHGAQAAAQLSSPHVVRVFAYAGTDEGVPYIVMELLSGESLEERLDRDGPLSLSETAHVVRQLASALDELHALHVVHCNIAPANIFLAGPGQPPVVKLLDFDSVELAHRHAERGPSGVRDGDGTEPYTSPEQLSGAEFIDLHADLWALSVVAYRALTGRVPFTAANSQDLLREICAARFAPASQWRSDLPASIDGWFRRAFARGIGGRLQSARAMAAALDDAIAQSGAMAPRGDDPRAVTTAAGAKPAPASASEAREALPTVVMPEGVDADIPPLEGDTVDESLQTSLLSEELQAELPALAGDTVDEPLQTCLLPEDLQPPTKHHAPGDDEATTVELDRRANPVFEILEAKILEAKLADQKEAIPEPEPELEPWEMMAPRRRPWGVIIVLIVVTLAAAIALLAW